MAQHLETGAEVTIGTIEWDRSAASRFGIVELDREGRIVGWEEKPAHPKPSSHKPEKCHASMGIYCFDRDLLIQALIADAEDPNSGHDFGHHVVPQASPGRPPGLFLQLHRRKPERGTLLAGYRND